MISFLLVSSGVTLGACRLRVEASRDKGCSCKGGSANWLASKLVPGHLEGALPGGGDETSRKLVELGHSSGLDEDEEWLLRRNFL